jgi:hypothetical protein
MRPWKIVLAGTVAAFLAAGVMLWLGLSGAGPDRAATPLLSRLPVVALILIAVYALVAIVSTLGGLVGAALDLRRALGRIKGITQAAAAVEWVAAFDDTALRPLAPRVMLSNMAGRRTTILSNTPFDPGKARAEAAHLYYIWLARTQSLGALVGLGAIATLGSAQAHGAVAFLPGPVPAGPAAVVLVGLGLLILLGRCAIDVTTDPLIDAMSRLPWEQADVGQLRLVAELLEPVRLDGGASDRGIATAPHEILERLTLAFEDGSRALAETHGRLSAAADAIGTTTGSAMDVLAAAEDRLAGVLGRDRRDLADAAERLSATASAIGATTRSTVEALAAAVHDGIASGRGQASVADETRTAALQASVDALTAELRRNLSAEGLAGALDRDRQALADAAERLAGAADTVGAASRSTIDALAAVMRDGMASLRTETTLPVAADETRIAALQTAIDALITELRQLTMLVVSAREMPAGAVSAGAAPELALELRKLLEEI